MLTRTHDRGAQPAAGTLRAGLGLRAVWLRFRAWDSVRGLSASCVRRKLGNNLAGAKLRRGYEAPHAVRRGVPAP